MTKKVLLLMVCFMAFILVLAACDNDGAEINETVEDSYEENGEDIAEEESVDEEIVEEEIADETEDQDIIVRFYLEIKSLQNKKSTPVSIYVTIILMEV